MGVAGGARFRQGRGSGGDNTSASQYWRRASDAASVVDQGLGGPDQGVSATQ